MSGQAIRALCDRVAELPTVGAKLVLLRLMVAHRPGEDEMRCSISFLARELGVDRKMIRRSLEALEDAELAVRLGDTIMLRVTENVTPEDAPELPLNPPERPRNPAPDSVDNPGEGGASRPTPAREGVGHHAPGGWGMTPQKVGRGAPPLKEEEKEDARARAPEWPLDIFPVTAAQRELVRDLSRFRSEADALAEFREIMALVRELGACGKGPADAGEERALLRFVRYEADACREMVAAHRAKVRASLGFDVEADHG